MRRARPLLGTLVDIAAEGAEDILPAAIEAAFASIERIQKLMSFHDAHSDVSRINEAEAGSAVDIDPHTYRVLEFALELSEISAGAFDITTGAILVESGFLPGSATDRMSSGATYRDLDLLSDHRVCWRRPGCIDLGGIAKGYAVDCAIAVLRAHGVVTAIVNAGGDLRCFGEAQPIHLRHPDDPTLLMGLGWLADAALATSAGYFSGRDIGSRRIEPLVDPKRPCCISWDGSVSVAAPDCMTADALTKVVRLALDAAPDILERFNAQAVVIDKLGSRCCGQPWLLQEGITK